MSSLGGNAELVAGLLRFTCCFNMTGNPTITLPGGFTDAGTPVGKTVSQVFTSLLTRQFGEDGFTVEHVSERPQ